MNVYHQKTTVEYDQHTQLLHHIYNILVLHAKLFVASDANDGHNHELLEYHVAAQQDKHAFRNMIHRSV